MKTAVASDEPERSACVEVGWSTPADTHIVWTTPVDLAVTRAATTCSLTIHTGEERA